MKNKIIILTLLIFVGYLTGKDGCPFPSHNRGIGERIAHGACIQRLGKDANGKSIIIRYDQEKYTTAEDANCNGISDEDTHCSLVPETIKQGLHYFSPNDSSCTGKGEEHNVITKTLKCLKVSPCNHEENPKPQA
ncbi:MAG: hypothetical protein J6R08_02800 [Opitutales bacterium]|nr:hypothetical protein [Opitutales bacterium]